MRKHLLGPIVLVAAVSLLNDGPVRPTAVEYGPDYPAEAYRHELETTRNRTTGRISQKALLDANWAARQSGNRVRAGLAASPFGTFKERGPDNVGGRTRALMLDPNIPHRVWAGGVGGGLWVNPDIRTDQRWQNIDEFWQNLAISGLTFDPNNPQIFYASTGEQFSGIGIRGLGIFRSLDGGATWDQDPLPATTDPGFESIQSIAIAENGTIIAAARRDIRTSTDGGLSWTSTLNARISRIRRLSDGTLLAGGITNGTIYRSSDHGQTWPIARYNPDGRRVELCASGTTPETVYAVMTNRTTGAVGAFERSTDSGVSWQPLGTPVTNFQGWYDLVCAVNPLNHDQAYVGVVRMHRTDDAGQSWSSSGNWDSQHADHHAIIIGPPVAGSVPVIWGNDGGVYFSANGFGSSVPIESREIGYNTAQYYSADQSPVAFSNDMFGGTQDNGTHQFDAPGINKVVQRINSDGAFTHIDQLNPDVVFGSTQFLNISRSRDGGATWDILVGGGGQFVNPSDYNDQSKTIFAYRNAGALVRCVNADVARDCTDVGYSDLSGRVVSSLRVSRHSPEGNSTLYIASSGRLYRVDQADIDAPFDLLDMDPGRQLPPASITSVTDGATLDDVLVTLGSYETEGGQVWHTVDGGETWLPRGGNLPGIPVRWAEFNPVNFREVMLATEAGVWGTLDVRSDDPVWVREPTVPITRIDQLRYRESDGQVLVATHGRGLWTGYFRTPPGIVVKAKLSLQGASEGGAAMRTDLRDAGLLPLEQPFGGSPWNYAGRESVDEIPEDIVDWVLLEIREAADLPGRKAAAFLKSDGTVLSIDGVTPLRMAQATPGQYFIVVHQRNHLPVISPSAVTLGG